MLKKIDKHMQPLSKVIPIMADVSCIKMSKKNENNNNSNDKIILMLVR